MMYRITAVLAILLLARNGHGTFSEDLGDWILGTNEPDISTGTRGDGTTGDYVQVPVGTSPFYYEVMDEGEGSIQFWINDPGNCVENPNPGYPVRGPKWGLQTASYAALTVGIDRASQVGGCIGYSPWSTVSPYSPWWFKDGIRGSNDVPWSGGWTMWTVTGGWDNILFTVHDVDFLTTDGPPHDDLEHGDCTQTYNATSFGGSFEVLFGDGWQAFHIRGDGDGGVEDISIQVTAGTGVFSDAGGTIGVAGTYSHTTWGAVKALFK